MGLALVRQRMQETGLQVLPASGYCVGRRWCCSRNQLVQAVLPRKDSSARRTASKGSAVERNDGAKSVPWQVVEGMWDGTVYARNVGAVHRKKEHGPKQFWQMPRKRSRKADNVSGDSPFKEELDYLMRRAYHAGKSGDWEGYKVAHLDKGEISDWACSKVKESYDKVAMEDIGRLSVAQDIL